MIDRSVQWRMLVGRVGRNPLSSIALVLLIAISAATAGVGVFATASTIGATDRLFELAKAPDAVQMHVGAVDSSAIDGFADAHADLVVDHQVQTALQLDNADLHVDGTPDLVRAGVMDLLLVTQSPRFDLLLDRQGHAVSVEEGMIAVPAYYADAYGLDRGDAIEIVIGGVPRSFTVSDVVLDAQMGPSLVNSKRFVVSPADWGRLADELPHEHILTFLLSDGAGESFTEAYRLSGLPANGPAVDGSLLRLITGLSDGLLALVTIVAGVVLLAITLLCLRAVVLTALEEDTRRIGVLRAIGFSHADVRRALLFGYAVHAFVALAVALLLAFPASALLSGGRAAPPAGAHSVVAVIAMLATIVLTAALPVAIAATLLRRVRRISPLAALLRPTAATSSRRRPRAIRWAAPVPVTLRLGLRGLRSRPGTSILLVTMVACAVALALLPIRITQTIAAPDFVTTMGVGQSDIRAFIRSGAQSESATAQLESSLRLDRDVVRFASTTTFRVELDVDGERQTIALEAGDTASFPVTYVRGSAPTGPGEIALSTLSSESAAAGPGTTVVIRTGDAERRYRVTGVYNDITNGGRSGKVVHLDATAGAALWTTVLIDVRNTVDRTAKTTALGVDHPAAAFTELDRFVANTLGDTVDRLRSASLIAGGAAAGLMLLVFTLRGRLEIARDEADLRLLHLLGWDRSRLRAIPLVRASAVVLAGLGVGIAATEALGPAVLGGVLSTFGGAAAPLVASAPPAALAAAAVAAAGLAGALLSTVRLPALRNES